MQLISDARTDLEDFWRLSGVLTAKKLPHTPFLVFDLGPMIEEGSTTVEVHIVDSIQKLLVWPDALPVLCQWGGNWSSDYFQFTVGEARAAYEARNGGVS